MTVRKPQQCYRALAGSLEKNRRIRQALKCLVMQESAAHEMTTLRSLFASGGRTQKVRIINDISFDAQTREIKGGLNGDSDTDTAPQFLCAEALSKFIDELVTLKKKDPGKRALMRQDRCVRRFPERASRLG